MLITLSTYPRCGSNLLTEYLRLCTNVQVMKMHKEITDRMYRKPIVTIIRNPFDSIVSIVAMERRNHTDSIDDLISKQIGKYIEFYKYIDNFDIVFQYDELINDPSKFVDFICDAVGGSRNGLPYVSNLVDREVTEDSKENAITYAISSKNLDEYNAVSNRLKDYDLSECVASYEKALATVVVLD